MGYHIITNYNSFQRAKFYSSHFDFGFRFEGFIFEEYLNQQEIIKSGFQIISTSQLKKILGIIETELTEYFNSSYIERKFTAFRPKSIFDISFKGKTYSISCGTDVYDNHMLHQLISKTIHNQGEIIVYHDGYLNYDHLTILTTINKKNITSLKHLKEELDKIGNSDFYLKEKNLLIELQNNGFLEIDKGEIIVKEKGKFESF